MTDRDNDIQKSLAPPGAGLSPVQAFILRYLLFPLFCRTSSRQKAIDLFQQQGDSIIALVEPLSDEQLQKRVLVQAPLGLEDSSRYWSAEMVMEHLIIVGNAVAAGIVKLSHGEKNPSQVDIAAVKPKHGKTTKIIEDYKALLKDYVHKVTEEIGNPHSKVTHLHPWFGQLNAHQWTCLGALHQKIHRQQIERIIAALDAPMPRYS